jgi:hypothetical protein
MNARTQITMDPELHRRAHDKAAELGISFAEYVRRLVAQDIGEQAKKSDISVMFDLIDEGAPTHIARDKDRMIGKAVWEEYLNETRRKPRQAIQVDPALSVFVDSFPTPRSLPGAGRAARNRDCADTRTPRTPDRG